MNQYAETMAEDAATVHSETGWAAMYHHADGSEDTPVQVVAVDMQNQLKQNTEGRVTGHKTVLSVPKAVIGRVTNKGDRLTIPGHLVNSDDEAVSVRVAGLMKELASPTSWIFEVAR